MTIKAEVGPMGMSLHVSVENKRRKWGMVIRRSDGHEDKNFFEIAKGESVTASIRQLVPNAATMNFAEVQIATPLGGEFRGVDGDYVIYLCLPKGAKPEDVIADFRKLLA